MDYWLLDCIRNGVLISECVCDEVGTSWNGTFMTSEDNSSLARTKKEDRRNWYWLAWMGLETGTSVVRLFYSHMTTTMTSYGCDLKIVCVTIPCAVCAHKYRRGGETVVCVTVYTLLPANMNTKWPHGQCWRLLLLLEPSAAATPPPPTFNRQLMCYETLGSLRAATRFRTVVSSKDVRMKQLTWTASSKKRWVVFYCWIWDSHYSEDLDRLVGYPEDGRSRMLSKAGNRLYRKASQKTKYSDRFTCWYKNCSNSPKAF